ncbi:antirestriction protein ArdA [[Clostridium] symbiosum]|uniref:Antirestriction protein ArdA n=1 Tax=Clostridium symbiosum TaxID=1512 RepID=A0AAW6APQ7_CLOSY|nr:antirestriction protein ArdA [[Clostridium] symbiosum]MDB1976632.1 antirestriction protein ArdA [[Clostridium] symbiosum]MDB1981477.1 antirestriction protein ArdA [[Clostridium] symbiosum]MDB1985901.1 antirestriction protein ArdA [[Clostridium] symbiosum]MDB1990442.1 antirestriction protein ArdA [[Clostridium] symbiosum]MDB1995008.1 antirestriction protein ArdA [[Clostridium] symbiosum]
MPYSSYDHDKLETAETMRIERRIYFEAKDGDIAPYVSLPPEQLHAMREESAAAEQAIFNDLSSRAAAWEEQAGKTLLLDKAIEYTRTTVVQHTSNEWQKGEYDRYTRSNRVYQMNYHIYENTRYDREKQQSVPYSYSLTWGVYTNSPNRNGQAKIAGQDRKVFSDKAAMEKYLNGRIKAYDRLFTEISPPIPQEYAEHFKVNGMLLPDYTIEGEEPPQQQPQTAAIPETTGQQKEREHMSEQFSIMIGNRSRFEAGDPDGYWLDMPATKEQLHEAMQSVGITADNPQDFSIRGFSDDPEKHIALPYDMVCAASVDELNFLAARIEQLDPAEIGKLNAALQQKNGFENIGQVIDFTYNVDFYVHIPEVHTYRDLGDYYLNQSGMVQMPEEWKGGIDLAAFGRNAAEHEKGAFTEYGYIVESGDEWERQFEGREVPEEYRIMSYPQPERGEQDKTYMDAAEVQQAAVQTAEPQQPRPVVPIILTSEKPAEKVKEITARLEQGVQAIFDSDSYKEFLTAMSKFHDYSLNNTILIAMQGGNLVMGFRQWEKEFDRHVKKGEKGIKIFAPAPYKVKKLVDKIDPETRKPMLDREGKPIKEEKEITVPAFKVITVFDISQTEGKEFPDLSVKPLLADVEQYEDFFAALEKASPVPIAFEQITNGANGYFSLTDKRIAIKEGVSELQAVKTAIHEIAHAKLHDVDLNAPPEEQNRVDRHTREVEAESVAYTVCQHFGLDTSDYSFGYVAGWSSGKEMTELKASLETIQATAKEIITEIEGHFTELQQQRQAEQEQQTPVFDKLPPEQQQALSDTVKDTLQMLVDADKRIYGDVTGKTLEAIAAQGYSYKDGQLEKQQPEATPESLMTGETVRTPRGNFHITDMSREQIEAAGFGFHHASEDGKYLIMGNGTQAFAIAAEQPQRDNPLKHVEDIVEQNDNNFDGIINNTPQAPTVADLEQRAKAGEAISVTDLAKAVKAEKREQPQKKPSILKKLDEYKKQAAQQPKDKQKEQKKDLEV